MIVFCFHTLQQLSMSAPHAAACRHWRAGIRHIHAMPIRSSPNSLLAVLNLGFKHEPCLDMGFMGPHLFSTYLSLISATLTAVVRDPGLNAYVCLARDLAEANSLDSIMQVRLTAGFCRGRHRLQGRGLYRRHHVQERCNGHAA